MQKSSHYQIPLSIGSSFTYRPEFFVEHVGVRAVFDQLALLAPGSFYAAQVVGPTRSGKTHLGFCTTEYLQSAGFEAVLRAAPDLRLVEQHLMERGGSHQPLAVCIDDAHKLILTEDTVAPFVALYEQVRQSSGVILLFTSQPLSSENPHLQSRFASLAALQITAPAREDQRNLLHAIAKQRGLKLKSRDQKFLERRLKTDIAELEQYTERLLTLSSSKDGPIGLETLKDAI